jgi:GTP-binding protein Era
MIGNPNAGKSTLMNRLVGEAVSVITAKAQTTRHRIKGIVNGEHYQIVYSDLPGILTPVYKMQEMMMHLVNESLLDADLLLYVAEYNDTRFDEHIIAKINQLTIPVILVVNKIDLADRDKVEDFTCYWQALLPRAEGVAVSAKKGIGIEILQQKIIEKLPISPPYFPKEDEAFSDRSTRFFTAELIREQILLLYQKEIPYSVEVEITDFKEDKNIVRISATLHVERESQKAILLGHKGIAIKQLGIQSRQSIEQFLGNKVYLELSVKVCKNWRDSDLMMKRFGYDER